MNLFSHASSAGVRRSSLCALAFAGFAGAAASAQTCTPQWQALPSGLPLQGIQCSLYADIDGPDGEGEVLVVGGGNGIYVLRSGAWVKMSAAWTVSMTMWDQDGDGPLPARLIAGGNFNFLGVRNIAMWMGAGAGAGGSGWAAIGDGQFSGVNSLTTWDADGDGPLPAYLVSSGSYVNSGTNGSKWNGTTWSGLGSGLVGGVTSLFSYDPDGPGPLLPRIAASGFMVIPFSGSSAAIPAADFDGSSWTPIGGGFSSNAQGMSIRTFDFDGAGPDPAQLVLVGGFSAASGNAVSNIARWDGASWQPLGAGLSNETRSLAIFDHDGPGPAQPELYAAGFSTSPAGRVARWDGSAWQPLGAGANGSVITLTAYDPDGNGPSAPKLFAGGSFTSVDGISSYHAALWGCTGDLPPACPADMGSQGGIAGADGALDNNDFIVFIQLFFSHDAGADLGSQGGLAGSDGQFDNNDFVVFIDLFFGGCP